MSITENVYNVASMMFNNLDKYNTKTTRGVN